MGGFTSPDLGRAPGRSKAERLSPGPVLPQPRSCPNQGPAPANRTMASGEGPPGCIPAAPGQAGLRTAGFLGVKFQVVIPIWLMKLIGRGADFYHRFKVTVCFVRNHFLSNKKYITVKVTASFILRGTLREKQAGEKHHGAA